MPTSKDKKVFHLVADKNDMEKFNRQYPGLLKIFLCNALNLGANNKDFFETVFFKDVRSELDG